MILIDINKKFVEALESKIPKKTDLADFISETLFIEKETAYRRLRGEVQFSLHEAIVLSSRLRISIEEIMVKENLKGGGRNSMQLPINQTDIELYKLYISSTVDFLKKLTGDPYSEYGLTLTHLTFSLVYQFNYLIRFNMLKHAYYAGDPNHRKTFDQVHETESLRKKRKTLYALYAQIKRTFYIWDSRIIPSLISDILYFKKLRLISAEEVELLKEELHLFLQKLEQLTTDGYNGSHNRFELYISETAIEHTYAYLYSENYFVSMSTAFINYELVSFDKSTFENVSKWVRSLMRSSILISGSAEKEKINFFQQQHTIVDRL